MQVGKANATASVASFAWPATPSSTVNPLPQRARGRVYFFTRGVASQTAWMRVWPRETAGIFPAIKVHAMADGSVKVPVGVDSADATFEKVYGLGRN